MIISRLPGHRQLLLAGSLAALLTLTGCGSDDDSSTEAATPESSAPADDGAETEEETGASGDDTCAQLDELGASAQAFQPVQNYLPKEGLAEEIEARLTPMTSVTPPAELAEAWGAWQGFLEAQDAATAALPAGGRLDDPALLEAPADVQAAQEVLRDWWFDTCV